jgi:DMATS type aromatic prenyltransferase
LFASDYFNNFQVAMPPSFSARPPKRDQVTVTTIELANEDHPFPSDTSKSILSKDLGIFQELLSSKTLQSTVLDTTDNQALVKEHQFSQEANSQIHLRPPTVKQMLTDGINPTSSMFNSEPFTPSPRGPCFANSTQAFWYLAIMPLLSKLLSAANYPPHLQDQYLFFHNHSIIPALGPSALSTNKWTPHLSQNISPFEASLALKNNRQQIRYTFEPIGPYAGTCEDRFNQSLPLSLVSAFSQAKICPNMNLEWWNQITSTFFISDAEIAVQPSLFAGVKVHPTCFLAFDLPSTDFAPILETYLFPHRRAVMEGISREKLVFKTIRNLSSAPFKTSPALEKVEGFLSKDEEISKMQARLQESGKGLKSRVISVEMLSFDCISPSSSRLKIYAKTHDASFSNLLNTFTLGGTSDSPYTTGSIKALERFWKSVLLLGDDWSDYDSQSAEFLYFCFEISPGKSEPEITVYVPSWTLGIDKTGLTRGLRRCFRELGCDAGRSYKGVVLNLL